MAKAIGSARSTDSNLRGGALRASSGGGMTFTKASGLGKEMVANLDRVVARAKRTYREDRRLEALERRADRQQRAAAMLDTLLDQVQA